MEAMEKQVDISQERALQLGVNQKIQNIRAILDESGNKSGLFDQLQTQ
jgi:hypothetical protein